MAGKPNSVIGGVTLCRKRGRVAFTLIELLICVTIIVVLIVLLLPTLGKARDRAKMVSCVSNVRQIGLAASMYTNEWSFLPTNTYWYYSPTDSWSGYPEITKTSWWSKIMAYSGTSKIGTCPLMPDFVMKFGKARCNANQVMYAQNAYFGGDKRVGPWPPWTPRYGFTPMFLPPDRVWFAEASVEVTGGLAVQFDPSTDAVGLPWTEGAPFALVPINSVSTSYPPPSGPFCPEISHPNRSFTFVRGDGSAESMTEAFWSKQAPKKLMWLPPSFDNNHNPN